MRSLKTFVIFIVLSVAVLSGSWLTTSIGLRVYDLGSQPLARGVWAVSEYTLFSDSYVLDFNIGSSYFAEANYTSANEKYAEASNTMDEQLLCKVTYNWGRSLQELGKIAESDDDVDQAITSYSEAVQKASRKRCRALDEFEEPFEVLLGELEDKLAELQQQEQNQEEGDGEGEQEGQAEIDERLNDTESEAQQVKEGARNDRIDEDRSEDYDIVL